MEIFNRRIEFKSLFRKGLPPIDDRFGVYFVCGRQGSGKSYYAVKLLLAQDGKTCASIYTNVHSLKLPNYNVKFFDRVDELYTNTDEYCIFLIDEISRKWDKNSRTDTQFYAWLNQSRKRKRIVIMITQEWRELPMWIRRNARTISSLAKRVGVASNYFQPIKSLRASCRYLTHIDTEEKNKYNLSDVVVSNSFMRKFYGAYDDLKTEGDVIDDIYNYVEYITSTTGNVQEAIKELIMFVNKNNYDTIYKRYRVEFLEYLKSIILN